STLAASATDATGTTTFTFTPNATLYYRTISPGQPTGTVSRGVVVASQDPAPVAAPPAPAPIATQAPAPAAAPPVAPPSTSADSNAGGAFDRAIAAGGVTAAVWNGGTTTQLSGALGTVGATSLTTFANGAALVYIP